MERQRWKSEEDALLLAYVKQYGPREWSLVSQRMNVPFHRDAKSCLERWNNYLKPGVKKGSLTEEEQRLVIHLQAKHGNKWKKIAAEIPGRTAKRLGKWWEVFREKQQRKLNHNRKVDLEPFEPGKYDQILENFAEKLVKQPWNKALLMETPNLPSWLLNPNPASAIAQSAPSVSLTLSSTASITQLHCLQSEIANSKHTIAASGAKQFNNALILEIAECCREMEEEHKTWILHRKEASWRLKRIELQIESEKVRRKKEKMEEIRSKVKTLEEQQKVAIERIETEHREQLVALRRDTEEKEQKLVEQWAASHICLMKFLEQIASTSPPEEKSRICGQIH